MSALPSERFAIVATMDPVDANNTDLSTDVIDMSVFGSVAFILQTGVVASSGTLDFAIYESDAADGSAPSAITGKAITQIVAADDNIQKIINVRGDQCTKRYILGTMANSANSQLASVVALGFDPRYTPTSAIDLASVTEIVN